MGTQARGGTVLPGSFDEGAAGDGVARFGDAALAAFVAGGVLVGNQAEKFNNLGGWEKRLKSPSSAMRVAACRRANPRNAIKARTTGSQGQPGMARATSTS